ncbi:MAG TPA: SusC/RagA family TonB-linked outer membrane protein [Gemmatimonadaceae bacterium]|nr:SusC/RagA family TonB-linked outer membrane protein [Gemmatimonadaceae bacterium]
MKVFRLTPALLIALVLGCLTRAAPALAQGNGVIQGMVIDSTTRQPIPSAQVQILGGGRRAITDPTGRYTLTGVLPGRVTVRVQRVGFVQAQKLVTVDPGSMTTYDVTLAPIATTLSQVVVVGYGSSSRADVSSAVSTVSAADIQGTPVAGVDAMLQGKTAGVQVTQNAGNPGNGISVRVRGASSITAQNQPLWVVDGIPVQSADLSQLGYSGQNITAITTLNPDEIENITVLKDAAATAIYGSRASNGVIMVTTKRGRNGPARMTFSAYRGNQTVERKLSLLNAQQYIEYMHEGAINDKEKPENFGLVPGVDDKINTDWQDLIMRTAPISDLNLGVTGGSDRTRYYLSGAYFGQDGIVMGSSYNRASGRLNFDFDPSSRLSLSTSINVTREVNYRIQGDASLDGIVTNAIGNPPQFAARHDDGTFTNPDDGLAYSNSLALATYNSSPTTTYRTLGNLEARYKLMNNLQFTARVGGDQLVLHERQWQSQLIVGTYAASANGVAKSGYSTGNRFVGEGFLTFTPWSGLVGSDFSLTAGASTERNNTENNFVRGEGFSSPDLHDAGNATTITDYGAARGANRLVSFFSRANLNFRDRYLATLSVRSDGSSKFGENNRYATFPAISLGWLISEEPFLRRVPLGSLKLRGSYGLTGNQGIGNSAFRSTFGSANYGTLPGTAPSNFANQDLKWETTRESNVGIDWTFLDSRVTVIGDLYKKKTSDLLLSRPITGTTGFTSFTDNIGNMENTGAELELNVDILRPSNPNGLSWVSDFNVTRNKNRVTALYNDQPVFGGVRSVNAAMVGQPLGAYFLIRFKGVDPATGNAIYDDINGDKAINASDRIVGGSPQPTRWGAFTNTLSYGMFDVRAAFQFSGGNQIFNAMRIFADDGGFNYDNKFTDVLKRWQKPGDVTDQPRASFDGTSGARTISTRFIEPGGYTRFQELTFGVKIPRLFSGGGGFKDSRLYVSGRNLHTWTKYSGYNPDVNSSGSGSSIGLGSDFYAYPLARTWMVGVSGQW